MVDHKTERRPNEPSFLTPHISPKNLFLRFQSVSLSTVLTPLPLAPKEKERGEGRWGHLSSNEEEGGLILLIVPPIAPSSNSSPRSPPPPPPPSGGQTPALLLRFSDRMQWRTCGNFRAATFYLLRLVAALFSPLPHRARESLFLKWRIKSLLPSSFLFPLSSSSFSAPANSIMAGDANGKWRNERWGKKTPPLFLSVGGKSQFSLFQSRSSFPILPLPFVLCDVACTYRKTILLFLSGENRGACVRWDVGRPPNLKREFGTISRKFVCPS